MVLDYYSTSTPRFLHLNERSRCLFPYGLFPDAHVSNVSPKNLAVNEETYITIQVGPRAVATDNPISIPFDGNIAVEPQQKTPSNNLGALLVIPGPSTSSASTVHAKAGDE